MPCLRPASAGGRNAAAYRSQYAVDTRDGHHDVCFADAVQTFWRAEYLGAQKFRLDGPPLDPDALGRPPVVRLWEYGVGDRVRQNTSVSIRRTGAAEFVVRTDVAVRVALPAGDEPYRITAGAGP